MNIDMIWVIKCASYEYVALNEQFLRYEYVMSYVEYELLYMRKCYVKDDACETMEIVNDELWNWY